MQGQRCPNCENDINEVMTTAVIAIIQRGNPGSAPITCPHCGEELMLSASVQASVGRVPQTVG